MTADYVVHYKDCSRYNWHDPNARCDGARCHPEPRIDAPRAVDQLAWWVQHSEELRRRIDMEMTMTDDQQLRLNALDRAITYHANREDSGSADDVITSAAAFETYLRSGTDRTSGDHA